jgi:hypothetical protein
MDSNELEIFALFIEKDIANKGIEEDLITSVLKDGVENHSIKGVVFFIESHDKKTFEY